MGPEMDYHRMQGLHRCFLGEVSGAVGPREPLLRDSARLSVHALAWGTARQPWCARTGMAPPGLVCWLLIFLIRAGFWGPRALPSPGAAAGFAFARISWRRVTGEERRHRSESVQLHGDRV